MSWGNNVNFKKIFDSTANANQYITLLFEISN